MAVIRQEAHSQPERVRTLTLDSDAIVPALRADDRPFVALNAHNWPTRSARARKLPPHTRYRTNHSARERSYMFLHPA